MLVRLASEQSVVLTIGWARTRPPLISAILLQLSPQNGRTRANCGILTTRRRPPRTSSAGLCPRLNTFACWRKCYRPEIQTDQAWPQERRPIRFDLCLGVRTIQNKCDSRFAAGLAQWRRLRAPSPWWRRHPPTPRPFVWGSSAPWPAQCVRDDVL